MATAGARVQHAFRIIFYNAKRSEARAEARASDRPPSIWSCKKQYEIDDSTLHLFSLEARLEAGPPAKITQSPLVLGLGGLRGGPRGLGALKL